MPIESQLNCTQNSTPILLLTSVYGILSREKAQISSPALNTDVTFTRGSWENHHFEKIVKTFFFKNGKLH